MPRAEMIDTTRNGRTTRNLRMALLILNYGHNNEIYGSMVSIRMKSIVPPAGTAPAPKAVSRLFVGFGARRPQPLGENGVHVCPGAV
jgi:hypothetical protein